MSNQVWVHSPAGKLGSTIFWSLVVGAIFGAVGYAKLGPRAGIAAVSASSKPTATSHAAEPPSATAFTSPTLTAPTVSQPPPSIAAGVQMVCGAGMFYDRLGVYSGENKAILAQAKVDELQSRRFSYFKASHADIEVSQLSHACSPLTGKIDLSRDPDPFMVWAGPFTTGADGITFCVKCRCPLAGIACRKTKTRAAQYSSMRERPALELHQPRFIEQTLL